jgi:hypothetical protein
MNPLDWSGPQGPLDVLMRFAGGALVLIVLSTVIFGALGGDEPADAVAAPTPSPSVHVTEPTGTQSPATQPPATEPTGSEQPSAPASTETASEPDAPSDGTDPAGISIQVLDGVLTDGGEAANAVAQSLRDQGYDVVAVNRARQGYEQTTVFYTTGAEAQARQVAAAIGASAVEEQPGNLSEQVQVHIVVADDQ